MKAASDNFVPNPYLAQADAAGSTDLSLDQRDQGVTKLPRSVTTSQATDSFIPLARVDLHSFLVSKKETFRLRRRRLVFLSEVVHFLYAVQNID